MIKKFFLGIVILVTGVFLFYGIYPDYRDIFRQEERNLSLSAHVSTASPDLSSVPLSFIPNQGQVNGEALFYAQTPGYTLWLTEEGLVFDSAKAAGPGKPEMARLPAGPIKNEGPSRSSYERDVSRLIFLDSSPHPEVVAADPLGHRVSYFRGNKPENWRTGIQASAAVVYKDLYPGIDLKVYGRGDEIEYDWIVRPGGNPDDIRFEYKDVRKSRIDKEGNIIVRTKMGEIRHQKPSSHQTANGKRIEVQVGFRLIAENIFAFHVSRYDSASELIIDPMVFVQSTYLGGVANDYCGGIAVSNDGAAFLAGFTSSRDFPVFGAGDSSMDGEYDAFVTKFSPSGKTLVFSTFLGGTDWDRGTGIAVDGNGVAYIVGLTRSADFPLRNPFQSGLKGLEDAFVVKLSPGGDTLIYSTFLGGGDRDEGGEIVVDGQGFMYVLGQTDSMDFPLKNAFKSYLIRLSLSGDAFVTKLTPSGDALIYSTYLGGEYFDAGHRIAVDASGAAYIVGGTKSADFPLKNPLKSSYRRGDGDAFITKLAPTGDSLIYSTYLGGDSYDSARGLAIDSSGFAYVTGSTYSKDFPVKNAFSQGLGGSYDAFVMKISPAGNVLEFSTYLGGSGYDEANCLQVDGRGLVYIAGYTYSSDFPLKRPHFAYRNLGGGFLTVFNRSGESLYFSTYLDAEPDEMALSKGCLLCLAGITCFYDLPMKNSFDPTWNGAYDIFMMKYLAYYMSFRDW